MGNNKYIVPKSIIFSDFDDTIIDTNTYKIPTNLTEQLKKCHKKVGLVLVTSRGWDGIRPYVSSLQLNLPQVTESGSKIFDPITENELYSSPLTADVVSQLHEIGVKYPIKITFSSGSYSSQDKRLLNQTSNIGRASIISSEKHTPQILKDLSKISRIHVISGDGMKDSPGNDLIDITPKFVDKRKGIEQWMRMYGKGVNCIYLAGNSEADLVMYEVENNQTEINTIAVQNGILKLKVKAETIIPSVSDDGFAQWLEANFNNKSDVKKVDLILFSFIQKVLTFLNVGVLQ
ncbi:MAG: Cof-type HAD-IIB family hydrolase, partial [bacterium]|nr:Cof-type HAD-IIB family hydrolase [bacterium]